MSKTKYRHLFAYLAAAILIFAAGWYGNVWCCKNTLRHKIRLIQAKGIHFTSPLLDIELPEGIDINQEPIPFKRRIESFVQKQIQNGRVREISVYYRDLYDGPWFQINEHWEFNPASMMKVPVLIAWLKRAETDNSVLNHTMIYDGAVDMSALQDIPPAYTITPGQSYTIEELLHYMISYSDNNATALLYNGLNLQELYDVIDGMDVHNKVKGDSNYVTIHDYSGYFRILYNASFLNRDMSEKALQILSKEDFQGIASGVPWGVQVASKFGESGQDVPVRERQLHEFGIVYHPTRPYILGIMTIGNNIEQQKEILRDISKLIYKEID
ncbi:MAG: serine hydrolase [Nitrospirae bacterium]|nr:serine hydrolase [Nitrospirota bacterium]